MAEVQIQSLRPKHHEIIEHLLAEPTIKMGHLAARIGVTPSWLSIVMHSDLFEEEYTKRRMAHSKELSRQVIERQLKVILKAYDKMDQILDDDDVEDRIVLDTATQTVKALGLSPSAGTAPHLLEERSITERETVREVAPGVIERARERIRKVSLSESFFGEEPRALPSPEG